MTKEVHSVELVPESSWMSLILCYMQSHKLPPDEGKAENIRRKVVKYTILLGKIYRMWRDAPMFRCLDDFDIALVFAEVHKRA